MTSYTPGYRPIDISDPNVAESFIKYAAGYAHSLSLRLHDLSEGDRLWLGQFHDDPRIACDIAMRRRDVLAITKRLKE